MDHQAFAQLLGNYGEFLGAIAVVVTLIYLAVQLRQNTKAMRSATMQSLFESTNAVWLNGSQSLERNEQVFLLGQKTNLSEAESLYVLSWAILALRTQENIYYQSKLGLADDRFVGLERRVRGAMSFPFVQRVWRDGFAQDYLSDEYIRFVNRVIQAD